MINFKRFFSTELVLQKELVSSLTHFVGLILAMVGLILLVVFADLYSRASQIMGFIIFGLGLVFMYLTSTLYHFVSKTHWTKKLLQKIDHSMIYVLIAATYTPIALVLPQRNWSWGLLGVIWGLAGAGIILKIFWQNEKKWLSPLFYIMMGWLAVVALPALNRVLPVGSFRWLLWGGIFYTVGVIFFGLERVFPRRSWFGWHEVFHLFVLAGSAAHFWFIFKYVLYL